MKIIKHLLILLLAITISSCQFTEEITIKNDGSGEYKLNMDLSAMMGAMKSMGQNDSLKKQPEKKDTLIYMKDIINKNKDSIAKLPKKERGALEALKDLKMHIKLDEAKGIMQYDFIFDFNTVSELKDIQSKIKKAQNIQDNKSDKKEEIENHDVTYSYTKTSFSRKVTLRDLSPEDQQSYDKKMQESKMFLSGSTYRIIYHFPKSIKEISYKGAQFSEDHKTITIQVAMDTLINNPKLLDFKVDF